MGKTMENNKKIFSRNGKLLRNLNDKRLTTIILTDSLFVFSSLTHTFSLFPIVLNVFWNFN